MYGLAVIIFLYFYIRLAMWIAKKLAVKREGKKWKWGIGVTVALIFILIPTADSILGHLYFNHLCSTEAGVTVYQTVELPAEYWDEKGNLKFYDETNGNMRLPSVKYEWQSRTETYPLFVEKDISDMKVKITGQILNERILFTYWGGWFARNFTPHNTAMTCGSDVKAYTKYIKKIFVPIHSDK